MPKAAPAPAQAGLTLGEVVDLIRTTLRDDSLSSSYRVNTTTQRYFFRALEAARLKLDQMGRQAKAAASVNLGLPLLPQGMVRSRS